MNNIDMKKTVGIISGTAASLIYAASAFAQATQPITVDPCNPTPKGVAQFICQLQGANILGGLLSLVFVVALLVALLFLVWGGLKWITSGGDKAGVEAARSTIVASILGLLVVVLSYFILNIAVQLFLGVPLSQVLQIQGGIFRQP